MRVLIDGHNAMAALKVGGKTHEEKRRNLLRRVAEAAPQTTTVFFDAQRAPAGTMETMSELGVTVRYCRATEADHAIIGTVRNAAAPGQIIVVTNDREVAGKATQLGARALSVQDFFGPRPARRSLGEGGSPLAPPGRRPPKKPEFTAKDFGLPDEIDLSDPDGDI
jgi:predicted RNA-binding protein with PIN domain